MLSKTDKVGKRKKSARLGTFLKPAGKVAQTSSTADYGYGWNRDPCLTARKEFRKETEIGD